MTMDDGFGFLSVKEMYLLQFAIYMDYNHDKIIIIEIEEPPNKNNLPEPSGN